MTVSASKPLRFKGDDRKVVLVGTMPNGDIVVTSFYGGIRPEPWDAPLVFSAKTGEKVGTGVSGSTLVLENAPVVSSGFHPIDRRRGFFGRGLTLLNFVWSDYPTADGAVEIVYEDDRPVDAKFHARP